MSDTNRGTRWADAEDLGRSRANTDDQWSDRPDPVPPVKQKRKRRAADLLLLLLALLLLGGGLVTGAVTLRSSGYLGGGVPTQDSGLRDLDNNVILAEDPEILDPGFLEQADAQPLPDPTTTATGTDGRPATVAGFRVPDLKLAVPLWAVNDVNGTMNPPGYREAYWVRNRGVAPEVAETGTVFIITHTVRGGRGPGNYFIDVPSQTVTLGEHSLIHVRDRTYQYTTSELVLKTAIGGRFDIWEDIPGRLVIITCWLNKQGTLDPHNLVIYADLVS